MKKYKIFILLFISCICGINCNAQFYTIEKTPKVNYIIIEKNKKDINSEIQINGSENIISEEKTINKEEFRKIRERAKIKSKESKTTKKIQKGSKTKDLTISELYDEIIKNDIKHPKIVLAQAILETGWFKSSVCRNKGNLFGLTNPKTGTYYEFDHWKESVKAYRDKVQYKYKGGNYLLWLKKIGYAEDPRYVSSLMEILEKHIL